MDRLLTTLEHWRCAKSVVDEGGFAQAAKALNKSQSSISHAVKELSERLQVSIFRIEGRRAVLTDDGRALLRRADRLLSDAQALENTAKAIANGFEVQLTVAVDVIVPNDFVIDALNRFAQVAPNTRVGVFETALSGTLEALVEGKVEMALSGSVPAGFQGTALFDIEFIPVARKDHPLHHYDRPLDEEDLRQHRQMVLRDSGSQDFDSGWLGSEQRWTFSSPLGSLDAIRSGSGFAWLPLPKIISDLHSGLLKPLNLRNRPQRTAHLQLVTAATTASGAGVRALATAFKTAAADFCGSGDTLPE